ncbi:hypothetical protein GCM10010255_80350 [Streptomyces coeruleofuscus]|uniref:Uncharacterized protein n=1 Tax=Streptomyces coeruleofuscus TaxID=66879 RepID=A0ABP5WF89_9ACTN
MRSASSAAGLRVVDGARGRGGEQLVDALPLRELRPTAFVVGPVLVAGVLARVEPGVLEGRRDGGRVHALRAAADHTLADAGVVDRLTGRGRTGNGTAGRRPLASGSEARVGGCSAVISSRPVTAVEPRGVITRDAYTPRSRVSSADGNCPASPK